MKGLIFTYALCYGGAVVSLFRPWYGLLIYVCFAIIKPPATWHWSVPAGNYSRIIAIAMLVGWLINGAGRWDFGKSRGILVAFFGFWVWGTLSAFFAASDATIAFAFSEEIAKILLPFLVALTLMDSPAKLKQLAWVITLSQSFLAFEANLSYFQGFNRIHEIGMAGIDNNSAAISMAAAVGLAFFLGLGSTKVWQKALALSCGLLCGHAVLLSFSRGAMVSLCVTGVVAFLLVARKPKDFLVFAAAVVVALSLAGKEVTERFMLSFAEEEQRDESAQSRLDLWKGCWSVMNQHPIFGIGPNHWRPKSHEYGFPMNKAAHSTWFESGAEVGFPGVGFLISMYCLSMWHGWRLFRFSSDPDLRAVGRMVIASLAGYLVAISFVTSWGLEMGYYLVLLGAGAVQLASRPVAQTRDTHRWPGIPHRTPSFPPSLHDSVIRQPTILQSNS